MRVTTFQGMVLGIPPFSVLNRGKNNKLSIYAGFNVLRDGLGIPPFSTYVLNGGIMCTKRRIK